MSVMKTNSRDELWDFFQESVRQGEVLIEFEKRNGELRKMRCTLVPEAYAEYEFRGDGRNQNSTPDLLHVWDLDENEWRSVRKDSLLSVDRVSRDD